MRGLHRALTALRTVVAQPQERRDRAVEAESDAERFGGEQELERKVQAAALRRAALKE